MAWYTSMPAVIEPVEGGPRRMVEQVDHTKAALLIALGYRFPRLNLGRLYSELDPVVVMDDEIGRP